VQRHRFASISGEVFCTDFVPDRSLLVSGAAGGVGSILVQLGRRLTGLTVIATASRPETVQGVTAMGAHYVIDHTKPLAQQVKDLQSPPVKYVASLTGTARNFAQLVEALAPEGKIGVLDDPQSLDAVPLKRKAASLHWEFIVRPLDVANGGHG
jgi:NADPH2:quinone reductase